MGRSGRSFKIRMFEHMGKSFRSGQFLQKTSFSAVRNHSRDKDHPFSMDDFEIIARFRSHYDALIGERLLINKLNPELNISNNS